MQRKRNGRAESTIITEVHTLTLLARKTNLFHPEEVKTTIANAKVSTSTKLKRTKQYKAFLKWKKIEWTPPTYTPVDKIPFMPSEAEIDILIASCRPKLATVLQLLKETAMRIGEAHNLKWTDINFEHKTVSITPEKGSNARIIPISHKLIEMLNKYPKTNETILPTSRSQFRNTFDHARKRTSLKLQNPRLLKISFHTLRHWKATMEYHRTKDILHVQQFLGHKDIKTNMIYINIEQALWMNNEDDWISKVSHDITEETKLINAGFELVRAVNETTTIYRKRK